MLTNDTGNVHVEQKPIGYDLSLFLIHVSANLCGKVALDDDIRIHIKKNITEAAALS